MGVNVVRRWTAAAVLAAGALGLGWSAPGAWADDAQGVMTEAASTQTLSLADVSNRVWTDARSDQEDDLRQLITKLAEHPPADFGSLKASYKSLEEAFDKREEQRQKKLDEVEQKLADQLTKGDDPESLSESLKLAVERFMVTAKADRDTFMAEPRIQELITKADAAAHVAEKNEDWFLANELFVRLHLLLEESGKYKPDVRRLGDRLAMMRMYVPEAFWKLRNDERLKEEKSPLPPYNGLGEDYHDRLKGVDASAVMKAVTQSAMKHIDSNAPADQRDQAQHDVLKRLLTGGIESLRVMVTTSDLENAFPGLKDEAKKQKMLDFLNQQAAKIESTPSPQLGFMSLQQFIEDAQAVNAQSVGFPREAILHEFGNGAMATLDEFSAIIWPDEVERFRRMTEGQFKGIGVQIQMDDETQMIKVITPIEGTPAQRAGIKAGDLIKKINGQSAVGLSLNQAVDLITGPENTEVTLTMERKDGDDAEPRDIEFNLVRAVIPIVSVKGWRKTGASDDQWDWFVDHEHKIGYVRLSQFTDSTTDELHAALKQMQDKGLRGLIFDLRFNPGGLLDQAVKVASTFVDKGTIVSTAGTMPPDVRGVERGGVHIDNIPVTVLINEGSASASEIVSGALRHYADKGDIDILLLGERSFGKGSVQNVWGLSPTTMMKLTTQYYYLPDGRALHRRPGQAVWGVDPHLSVQMLPEQVSEALKLRQDADVVTIDETGAVVDTGAEPVDPDKLITDGVDLQLQTALVLLQTKVEAQEQAQARAN